MPKDARNPRKMGKQWPLFEHYAFNGHTHHPGVFEMEEGFTRPEDMLIPLNYLLDGNDKAIVNVGSVGQPRDRNPNACYVIFEDDLVIYRRVPYDVHKTRKLIYQIDMLDNFLGDRIVVAK